MKKLIPFLMTFTLLFSLAGCADDASQAAQAGEAAPSEGSSSSVGDETAEEEQFTSRDMEVGYSDYVTVTLRDGASSADGEGVTVSGDTVTITGEGAYLLTGALSDGQILVDAPEDAKLQIVLSGASVSSSDSAAFYVKSADKVFLTTAKDSKNFLINAGEYVQTDENTVDAAIFAKSDLTVNGQGLLTVAAEYGHGAVSKDDLKITSGTVSVTAPDHALAGQDSVRVASGELDLSSSEGDGIHGGSDDTAGYVWIEGGSVTISAGDDGIHAEAGLTVKGGTVAVLSSCEGLEGADILLAGGAVSVTASDDGVNATSGSGGGMTMASDGSSLTISGGVISIDAGGDGLDSNGDLTVTGGETYVSGPTDSGNGAIDYGGDAVITGGTLIAAGASGMAEGFGDGSTQGSMLVVFAGQHSSGERITLTDASGAVLCQFTPEKSYNSAVISAPGVTDSGTYTVAAGSETSEITMTAITYGQGGMGGGFGGHGGGVPPQDGQRPQGDTGERPARPDATTSATVTAGSDDTL